MANNHGNARIDYYGTDEIIKKLETLGVDVTQALTEALLRSAEKPKSEMLNFIRQHRRTGETENSFEEKIKNENERIYLTIGFNLNKEDGKPGLPALFLNYGTPTQEPTFFIDKAIENNIDEIKRMQQETLEETARKAGLK